MCSAGETSPSLESKRQNTNHHFERKCDSCRSLQGQTQPLRAEHTWAGQGPYGAGASRGQVSFDLKRPVMQEYIFKVQAAAKTDDDDSMVTVSKVVVDMAKHVSMEHQEQHLVVQTPFSAGKGFSKALPAGQLRLKVSGHMVKVRSTASACTFAGGSKAGMGTGQQLQLSQWFLLAQSELFDAAKDGHEGSL